MPKRPWKSYRPVSGKAYVPKWKKTGKGRKYNIKHIPESKIKMFTIGKENPNYYYKLTLFSNEAAQINHLSLEAARIACNRYLRERLGRDNYLMKIIPYPHHVVREHKMMAFAGADRLQDGMRHAFGKPFGRAARVKRNQKLLIIKVYKDDLDKAKAAMKRAKMKFPMPCRKVIEILKTPGIEEPIEGKIKKVHKKEHKIHDIEDLGEEKKKVGEKEKKPEDKGKKAGEKEKKPGEKDKKAGEKDKKGKEKEKDKKTKGKEKKGK